VSQKEGKMPIARLARCLGEIAQRLCAFIRRRCCTAPPTPPPPNPEPRKAKVEDLIVPSGGPQGPVNPAEFSLVGEFDIGWLLDPGYERLLDNLAASPVAFKTVRIMKVFTSGINAPAVAPETGINTTSSGGTVWPAGGTIDLTGTLNALAQLTSRGLVPLVVLGFFPDGIYTGTGAPAAGPTGPSGPTAADWATIRANWKALVQAFFDALLADSRFGNAVIARWWFEVWNEPDNSIGFWNPDGSTVPSLGATPGPNALDYYQQLYQATSDLIRAKGYGVRLGGPAIMGPNVTGLTVSTPPTTPTLMSQFVDFVKGSGVKCDFLSFHGKGEWDQCLNGTPSLQSIVDAADQTAQLAQAAGLSSVTVINDEADMRVSFAVPFKPRMTEHFPAWSTAAMIAYDSLSAQYAPMRFMAASDDCNLQLVGWTEFTGTGSGSAFVPAAFGQQRSIMTAASKWPNGQCPTDLLKLPIYSFYELLRLLGDQHGTFLSGSNNYYPHNSDLFHAITVATTHIGSVFCVCPPNPPSGPSNWWTLNYSIVGIPWPTINWYKFQIDGTISNGFTAAGGPTAEPDATFCTPDKSHRPPVSSIALPFSASTVQAIRKAQELSVTVSAPKVAIAGGTFNTSLTLAPYTTTVLWITPYSTTTPATPAWAPTNPAVVYAADYGKNVLLRWQPDLDPAFYSYEVYRDNAEVPVSPAPLRSALWIDTNPPTGQHTYRILTRSPSGVASGLSPALSVTV
jgi:hypothetical protein